MVSGVETSDNALNYVQDLFNGLVNYGDVLVADGNELSDLFIQATPDCQEASELSAEMYQYFEYVFQYEDFVDPVPGQCSSASDKLHEYGTEYKNKSMWTLYGVLMLGVALYLLGLFLKSALTLQLSMVFTMFLMTALFIMCGVEMVIVVSSNCNVFSCNWILIAYCDRWAWRTSAWSPPPTCSRSCPPAWPTSPPTT